MAISPETIEEIYKTANIYDIVSKYINLEKSGSNYKALCPFHSEKTPSFFVSPSKNIFKCFGCGKAGDGIKFLMEYKGISYTEALQEVAQHYGIPIKYIGTSEDDKKLKGLYNVIDKIAEFYHSQLKKSPIAKEYLKKRNISANTAVQFKLGYSPENINELLEFAKKEGISIDELKEIGVLKEVAKGKYIDRFKGRLIFPIRNHTGKVVAFGGRALKDGQIPKYLNSPETKIYIKSKVLYGFFENRDYIREKKEVIIVEGYFDLLSMYQVGIKNVVATLGTAFTSEQGKFLKKFAEKAILMFDNDNAGKKALIGASKILLSLDIDVYKVNLEDKDPDELAQRGKEHINLLLQNKKDIFEDLIEKIKLTEDLKERRDLISLYVDLANYIPDRVKVGLLIKELSKATQINERYLENVGIKLNKNFHEELKLNLNLTKKEKIVLKALINNREEILKNFKDFDKIRGSKYFNYLIGLIVEGKRIDNDIISFLNSSREPDNTNIALKILKELQKKWEEEEEQLKVIFSSTEEDLLDLIDKKINHYKKLNLGG